MIELHHPLWLQPSCCPLKEKSTQYSPSLAVNVLLSRKRHNITKVSSSRIECFNLPSPRFLKSHSLCLKGNGLKATKFEKLKSDDDGSDEEEDEEEEADSFVMDEEERLDWRRKIRDVLDKNPDVVVEDLDPIEKRKRIEKLLEDFPLVVEEEDPNWPEDADGWGFKFGQFFDKISIKNVKKDDNDEYDSENELVWEDDDYIRPIKDIGTAEWEETVFKDISPLIVLVHNRYRRPKENKKIRDELEKAVNIIWNCGLPSPRCVAIDGVIEVDLVSALRVSTFPELIFTKAGKILYREKGVRTANELSKIMAFFYYGAGKPDCLNGSSNASYEEPVPPLPSPTIGH